MRHLDHAAGEPCQVCDADKKKRKPVEPNPAWVAVMRKLIRESRVWDDEEMEVWL